MNTPLQLIYTDKLWNDALELHYKIAEQRHIKTEDYNKLQEIKAKAGCNIRDLQFKATGYPVSYKRVRK